MEQSETTEKPEKPRNVFWSNFIMLAAPPCVWAEIALIVAKMRCAPSAF